MPSQPENMPADFEAAFQYLSGVSAPTINDFKLMAYVETGGEAFYAGIANGAPNQQIKDLLNKNGREERAHAHRLKKVIEKLSGDTFTVPSPAENPYYIQPEGIVVDKDFLTFLIEAEVSGDNLYETWASSVSDEECAGWLRQNGKEEINHSERAKEAMGYL
ncbi:MAG: rubrerythrin [Gammaproteobacteria bacterium]|jgi:rubrerythrin